MQTNLNDILPNSSKQSQWSAVKQESLCEQDGPLDPAREFNQTSLSVEKNKISGVREASAIIGGKQPLLYEVPVPFNCKEEEIELALLKFVVDLITQKQMHSVKKIFFVPVGLPGMGKSTLAKHIRLATEKHLHTAHHSGKSLS